MQNFRKPPQLSLCGIDRRKGGAGLNGQNRLVYLVRRMVLRFFSDGIPQAAAALSYFLLFSLLPLVMFVNALVARLSI